MASKKVKEREGTKSHVSVIFHLFVGKPLLCKRIFAKFCTLGDMLDIIMCANVGVEKLRGLEYTGVKCWSLPLKWLVALTTVLRYCTACDTTTP